MSIRTVLTLSIWGLVSVAAAATGCLTVFTIHRREELRVWTSAEGGIQLAEEIELSLLRLNRLRLPASRSRSRDGQGERGQLERDLRRQLDEAAAAATGARERRIVSSASQAITAYFGAGDDDVAERRLTAALTALGELVAFNVAEADVATAQVARWTRFANALGAAAGVLLIFGTATVFLWLRAAAFTPLFDLRHIIERFSGGQVDARAPDTGPAEIGDIARAFNGMADQLAVYRQRQLTFLAGVAHDLRAPLAPLKAAAAMGRRPEMLMDVQQAHRMFDVVARQVDQLERMTGDLLEAARLEGGRLDIRLEPCDVRTLASAPVELFGAQFETHRLELTLPDEPVIVRCDPVRIQQVLTNLVSNAIKYSLDGGTIVITVREDAGEASIAVMDEGIGIAREDLPHIFEPFRRAASVESTIAGVGLGLSISRRLVQAHGGRLDVTSVIGKGSTFTIRLPAEKDIPAGAAGLAILRHQAPSSRARG